MDSLYDVATGYLEEGEERGEDEDGAAGEKVGFNGDPPKSKDSTDDHALMYSGFKAEVAAEAQALKKAQGAAPRFFVAIENGTHMGTPDAANADGYEVCDIERDASKQR